MQFVRGLYAGKVTCFKCMFAKKISTPMQAIRISFPIQATTRMLANSQRDGRPAEYRWRPLLNAAKFGRCLLLECRAVMLTI